MNNDQRRSRSKELKDKLSPLHSKKITTSLRYNFLTNLYRQKLSSEEEKEVHDLKQQLDGLNKQIAPIFEELRGLQIKYLVEYDAEVLEQGILKTVLNKKVFNLATDAAINSHQQTPDYDNPDVWAVINEIKDYIYYNEYSQFTVQHIKRLE